MHAQEMAGDSQSSGFDCRGGIRWGEGADSWGVDDQLAYQGSAAGRCVAIQFR